MPAALIHLAKKSARPARWFVYALLLSLFLLNQSPMAVKALSDEQRNLFNKNVLYYNLGCADLPATSAANGDVDKFLKALSYQESGGNPDQPGSAGGARGKYQYIDSTWKSSARSYYEPALKYDTANVAPEEVQDAVAYLEYTVKFKKLDSDLFKLAVSHFYPIANDNPALLDQVPPSNVITPRQYAEKLINSIKHGGAWEKIPLKYKDAPEFDKYAQKAGVNPAEGDPNSTTKEGGAVYMLGDSITERAADDLKSEFKSNDFKPYINASVGRSITGKGTTDGFKTSGMEAVKDDKARITNAGVVVIALGTNQENDFEKHATDLIKQIKEYNSDAQLYWVGLFSKGGVESGKINKKLDELAKSEKFTVINTIGQVDLDSDNIHESIPEGSRQFARLVADAVAKGRKPAETAGAGCKCDGGGGDATGSNNTEIAYNFLIKKELKPMYAAAIVGNFIHESGGDPIKTNNPNPQSGANGIAQWYKDRLTGPKGLKTYAEKKGQKWDDINLQLDFLWEVDLPSEKQQGRDVIGAMLKDDNLRDATETWEKIFERSGDTGSYDERYRNAKRVLSRYGSGGGGGSSDSTQCASSGGVSGEWSLPVDKKWYKQHPEWFSKPHHDHPGADIPVPHGTPVYSISSGKIIAAPNEGGYGEGVTIEYQDGIWFEYGHGIDGGSVSGAKQGDTVKPGQLIMHVNNTGSSQGDHLHFGVRIKGVNTCPQKLLVGIAKGDVPDLKSLPTSGCFY